MLLNQPSDSGVGMLSRAAMRSQWRWIFGVGGLIGIIAGLGLGCLAGARRTDSSFARHLEATNAAHVEIDPGDVLPESDRLLRELPGVEEASYWVTTNTPVLTPEGTVDPELFGAITFTTDGRYLGMDRVVVSKGRLLDPTQPDEVMLNPNFAEAVDLDVGDRVRIGWITIDPESFGPTSDVPLKSIDAEVVGIMLTNDDVAVEAYDDIPRMFVSPGFEPPAGDPRELYGYSWYGLRLADGSDGVDAAVQAWRTVAEKHNADNPDQWLTYARDTAIMTGRVNRATLPLVMALTGLGVLVFGAALVLLSQASSRAARNGRDDIDIARQLGLTRNQGVRVALTVPIAAIGTSAISAVISVLVVSSWFPVGEFAALEPNSGFQVDGLVAVVGLVTLVIVPLVTTTITARRQFHQLVGPTNDWANRSSRIVGSALRIGWPLPIVAALQLTLLPGRGRSYVPTRSVVLSLATTAVLASTLVVFGSNLRAVANEPARFGWSMDAIAAVGAGYDRIDPTSVAEWAATFPDVAGWRAIGAGVTTIDGVEVPGLMLAGAEGTGGTGRDLTPVLTAGRAPFEPGEMVLGESTMRAIGAKIGDAVEVGSGDALRDLTVTGTAIMPNVGPALAARPALNRGAWLNPDDADLFDGLIQYGEPYNFIGFDLVDGANLDALVAANQVPPLAEPNQGGFNDVFTVVTPTEIRNTAEASRIQSTLVIILAVLAAAAMFFTMLTVVRRRALDLSIYRALGFTSRQVSATIIGQAASFGLGAVVVGVPLGVILGRVLWRAFADLLGVVPDPVTPWTALAVFAASFTLLAVMSSLWPAHLAVVRKRTRALSPE